MRRHRMARNAVEEGLAILAREVGHRAHAALAPQQRIGESGDVAHVDAGAHHHPALAQRAQGGRHQRTHRREDQRRIQRLGRQRVRGASPHGTQLACKACALFVARAHEGMHRMAFGHRDLRNDVRRRAKAIQAEA